MKWIYCLTVVFSAIIWRHVTGQLKSPYQASIGFYQKSISGSSENVIVCNGAVIHERFILTTADCLHIRTNSEYVSRPQLPSMFQVTAGTFDSSNTRHVEALHVHEKYNSVTFENDIALVQLKAPFDLKNNPSVQWIEIENRKSNYENCFISTNNQTSTGYPFTKPHSTYVTENWFCNKNLNPPNSSERNNDICSHYILNNSYMCKFQSNEYQVSIDRGTPLVCDNYLSGLLSQILPPQSISHSLCENTLKIWAFYTNVTNYAEWINRIIVNQQPPSHTEPPYSTNGAKLMKSLTSIVLFFSINLILLQI